MSETDLSNEVISPEEEVLGELENKSTSPDSKAVNAVGANPGGGVSVNLEEVEKQLDSVDDVLNGKDDTVKASLNVKQSEKKGERLIEKLDKAVENVQKEVETLNELEKAASAAAIASTAAKAVGGEVKEKAKEMEEKVVEEKKETVVKLNTAVAKAENLEKQVAKAVAETEVLKKVETRKKQAKVLQAETKKLGGINITSEVRAGGEVMCMGVRDDNGMRMVCQAKGDKCPPKFEMNDVNCQPLKPTPLQGMLFNTNSQKMW